MRRLKNPLADPSCGWEFDMKPLGISYLVVASAGGMDALLARVSEVLEANDASTAGDLRAIVENQIAGRIHESLSEEVL